MNAEERKVSGRMIEVTAAISVSCWRATSARAFESARDAGAEQAGDDDQHGDARDAVREVRPDGEADPDDDQRLDDGRQRAVDEAADVERAPPDGRDEEAVHDAPSACRR